MHTRDLPEINASVMTALAFFSRQHPPRLQVNKSSFPLVIGSGNAYNTGKIIFGKQAAVFANESDLRDVVKQYKSLITKKIINQAIVISASGEKDSVWELKLAKKLGLKTKLLTCSPQSSAAKLADETLAYRKLPEPYTYNVSTYLGMILSASGESPENIGQFIKTLKFPPKFSKYKSYAFILPDKHASIAPMLEIKRHELFGPHLSLRAFTYGEARHAKFIHTSDDELVISLGENKYFGKKSARWEIELPKNNNSGLVLALTYYLTGKIQESKPAYYKKNIAAFCQNGPEAYGEKKPFDIIVPGN